MARVVVVFTGGTISMLPEPRTGAAVPALEGAAILARTPGLDAIADVEPVDWGLVPATHMRFAQILDLARILQAALARPDVDGAVVVQGTDTIEETAFAFDLLIASQKPIVVVGAMRNAGDPGYEGPANLRDAVRVASSADVRGLGAMVVMSGTILPADDATKIHTHRYEAFAALNHGPLGDVRGDRVRVTALRARRRTLPRIPEAAAEPVPLITAVVSMDGTLLRAAVDAGARGIVVAAAGAGNTDPDLLAAAVEVMQRGIPVALTTRCASGRAAPAYGFPGGGRTWADAGAIFTGDLGGPKARVALALGLGAGLDIDGLRSLFGD